jgi:hypothetical protein
MLMRVFVLHDDNYAQSLWAFLKGNWAEMARAGRPLSVTVQEHKAKRSADQNRLYWNRLNDIAAQAWVGGKQFSAEAWHEHFKRTLIGSEEVPSGGSIGISTTTLSVAEFSDYINKVEAYAATELGITLT